jgi:hypothetical protein
LSAVVVVVVPTAEAAAARGEFFKEQQLSLKAAITS